MDGHILAGRSAAIFTETLIRLDTLDIMQNYGQRWRCWQPKVWVSLIIGTSSLITQVLPNSLVDGQLTRSRGWRLESWAQLPYSGDLLGEILRPAGLPVRDWLDAMPSGASWQPIATQWLLQLGLDLQSNQQGP